MSDRWKMPPERDFGFYQRRKHDKWRAVDAPVLEAPVADSHAHVHMLPDPAWELARCGGNGVGFICMIVDPSEDGSWPFDELDTWISEAGKYLKNCDNVSLNNTAESSKSTNDTTPEFRNCAPDVRIAVGVHPHNAKLYDDAMERELIARLGDKRVVALGEIGLDYHYDLSPRDVQRQVFRRQIQLAKDFDLPIALHLRGGDDPQQDDAHAEALSILQDEGFPQAGTLLHCCALPPDELRPWVEAGCYIAYGGVLTFKGSDAAREGAKLVPPDRLLLETDSPYMTPEPMRGATCTPAHVIFTAERLAQVCEVQPGPQRRAFLQRVYDNTLAFYRCEDRQRGLQ